MDLAQLTARLDEQAWLAPEQRGSLSMAIQQAVRDLVLAEDDVALIGLAHLVTKIPTLGHRMGSPEVERNVLGSMILDAKRCREGFRLLEVDDFVKPFHRSVYEALLDLAAEGSPPSDVILLVDQLGQEARNSRQRAEGYETAADESESLQAAVAEIVESVPVASHLHSYAYSLRRSRLRREQIAATIYLSRAAVQLSDVAGWLRMVKEECERLAGLVRSFRKDFPEAKT